MFSSHKSTPRASNNSVYNTFHFRIILAHFFFASNGSLFIESTGRPRKDDRRHKKVIMNAALFASRLGIRAASQRATVTTQTRAFSKQASAVSGAWNAVISRNFSYITFIVFGAITMETIYGGMTTGLWNTMNRGKLYKDIDWTKFVEEEEEEEDDE